MPQAERDGAESGINFKNRRKEIYDWENEMSMKK